MHDKKLKYLLIINSVIVVLLEFLGSLLKYPLFWGFNFLAYFSFTAKIFFIIFGAIIFIPRVNGYLLKSIEESSGLLKKNIILPLLLILYIPFYYIFHIRVHFLGDGPMILRMLPQMNFVSDMIATNEPGSYTIAVHLQNLIRGITGTSYSPEYVFEFLSVISGLIFIFVLFKYVNIIAENRIIKILYFIILFFTSGVIFFLGYVETYQVVFVLMLSYMVLGVLFLKYGKNTLYYASLLFGIWLSVHYLAALFIPSFIILLVFAFRRNVLNAVVSLFICFASFLIVFLFTGLDFSEMIKRFFEPGFSHWLPLFSVMADGTLPVFSFYHILDIVNSQLLASSTGIIALTVLIIIYFKKLNFKDSAVSFLGAICLASVFFIMFFNSHLGLSRDWDVAALMSYPFLFLFLYLVNINFKPENLKKELLLITYVSLWQVMLWLFVNVNVSSAEARNSNLADEKLWNSNRRALYFEELGAYYRNKQDYSKAIEYYRKGLETEPGIERIVVSLSYTYQKAKKYDEAERILLNYVDKANNKHDIYFRLGIIEMESGKLNEAILNFENVIKIEPEDLDALGNIAGCYYLKKDYAKSIEYSGKVISLNPELPRPYISLGDNYLVLGDTIKALMNYNYAKEKDKESKLKNEIELRIKSINKKQ